MQILSNRAVVGACLIGLASISCSTAGIRRAYVALDAAGNTIVDFENGDVVYNDDTQVHFIAEYVAGKTGGELQCRWAVGIPDTFVVANEDPGYRGPLDKAKTGYDFLQIRSPGRTADGRSTCVIEKRGAEGLQGWQIDWSFFKDPSGSARNVPSIDVKVEWFVDDELITSTTARFTNSCRFRVCGPGTASAAAPATKSAVVGGSDEPLSPTVTQ